MLGVIPAAGYAKRLLPIKGSKEMIMVNGKPIIYHLIDRMKMAGVTRIVIVTRPQKIDLIEEFKHSSYDLVLTHVPGGLARSVLYGAGFAQRKETILFGLPDTYWEPADAFRKVLRKSKNTLGLFATDTPEKFDVVLTDSEDRVTEIICKHKHPPDVWSWGIGCFSEEYLDVFRAAVLQQTSGPETLMWKALRHLPFKAVRLTGGRYVDIGRREDMALINPVTTELRL